MNSRFACLLAVLAGWAIAVSAQSLACPTGPAVLLRPANGASSVESPVQFDWMNVAGATSYQLMASFNGGQPSVIAVTTDSEYAGSIPAGPVEGRVVATDSGSGVRS